MYLYQSIFIEISDQRQYQLSMSEAFCPMFE